MTDEANLLMKYRRKLAQEKERISKEILVLTNEGRQDEANLQKIRLNIIGIFETVADADMKWAEGRHGERWAFFCKRYASRFHTLTNPWRIRLEQAKLHQDHEATAVEELKLETAALIERLFLNLEENDD